MSDDIVRLNAATDKSTSAARRANIIAAISLVISSAISGSAAYYTYVLAHESVASNQLSRESQARNVYVGLPGGYEGKAYLPIRNRNPQTVRAVYVQMRNSDGQTFIVDIGYISGCSSAEFELSAGHSVEYIVFQDPNGNYWLREHEGKLQPLSDDLGHQPSFAGMDGIQRRLIERC